MIYNNYKKLALEGSVALLTDTIKCALFTSSYTPNIDTDVYFDDISANEVVGTGYTTLGKTLASKTATVNTTTDLGVFDAADLQWTTASFTARYAVIFKDTGDVATSPLIAVIDLGSGVTVVANTFDLVWGATGVLTLS